MKSRITFHVLESVGEHEGWTPTLPGEFPFWELDFQWTPEFLEGNCRGQNSLDRRVFYIIWNLLKHKCLKWVRMTHLGYVKHKLWPKEGLGVKLPIWFPTTKNPESPWITCVQVACHISLESSRRRLQLFFILHLNRRSTQKIMGLQSCKSPNFKNFRTPNLGVLGQNDIWCRPRGQAQIIL